MSKAPTAKPKSKSAAKPTKAAPKQKAPPKAKTAKALTWPTFRALALSLKLPHVIETTSWGQPTLKAHGKLWAWWSPTENAPVFKVSFEERELLLEMEPDVFFVTDHYRPHPLVLARPDKVDPAWAKATLYKMWRAMAPKKALKAYDEGQG
jgi:hypothetical protein